MINIAPLFNKSFMAPLIILMSINLSYKEFAQDFVFGIEIALYCP